MVWPILTSCPPIGVDVGERSIKAVQFARGGRRPQICAATSVERQGGGAGIAGPELRQLRQRLGSAGFRGHSLALAVPGEKLLTGIMELPPASSGAPIEMLARSELARMHKCDPQSFEMASWRLPAPARAANTTFVMGAACTHADADSLLECFEAEGLRVERLEIQSQALARACGPLLRSTRGLAGILDIGWAAARLVLLYDRVVIYERKLPKSAYGALVGELAGELDVDAPQAEKMLCGSSQPGAHAQAIDAARQRYAARLAEEMRIPLSYVSNQYADAAADQLLLVGGGAGLDGLAGQLADAMDWPVRPVAAADLAEWAAPTKADCGSTMVVAAGLAWPMED
jgi:Tfp pilus assembly PilM family ATPase